MKGAHGVTRSSTAARLMERVLRRLLEHPRAFPLAGLCVSLAFALPSNLDSVRTLLVILAASAALVVWLHFWVSRRAKDPGGRSIVTIVLALVGSLILTRLTTLDIAFSFVALTLLPQYFTLVPIPVAILSFLAPALGTEVSHRMAVLADPTAFPWGIGLLRGAALVVIGVSFKVLSLQMEERARLQASLASAERKAGMLEERQRLAREIHDTLAQGFASIIVHFERAEQIDALSSSPAKPHLDLARSVAREGLEDARRMLAALRPEILEQRALPEALGRVCEDWSRRTGIEANLAITGAPMPMHPDIELTILRGVQEALTNIARHAGARTTAVTLSYMEDLVVLDVQDDGKGFVASSVAGNGFGLTGMRERTESLHGSFSLESVPGEGTTISISLPVLRPAGGDTPREGMAS